MAASYSCVFAPFKNLPKYFPLVSRSHRQCPRAWIHRMLTRQQMYSAAVLLLVKQNLVLNLGVVTYAFKHSIGKGRWISMSFQASHAYIVT